jgi:hypothetical protein
MKITNIQLKKKRFLRTGIFCDQGKKVKSQGEFSSGGKKWKRL